MKLSVAVPTYRRTQLLDAALPVVLSHIEAAQDLDATLVAHVLVVDNCPDGSAEGTVAALGDTRVRYVNERVPGISAARNRAMDENVDTDLLVFIDDDEAPTEHWLAPLLDTWEKTGAGAVMGRVKSVFEVPPDPWIAAGEFFYRPTMPTGTVLKVAATGNLLLDLVQVRQSGVRFNANLGLTGGEDSLFSRELVRKNVSIVWCDESVATDFVPKERLQKDWVLRRSWSHGNATTLVAIHLAESPLSSALVRVDAVFRGGARVVAGLVRSAAGKLSRSLHHEVRGMRTLYRGAGMLAGGLGHVYVEYARAEVTPSNGAQQT